MVNFNPSFRSVINLLNDVHYIEQFKDKWEESVLNNYNNEIGSKSDIVEHVVNHLYTPSHLLHFLSQIGSPNSSGMVGWSLLKTSIRTFTVSDLVQFKKVFAQLHWKHQQVGVDDLLLGMCNV